MRPGAKMESGSVRDQGLEERLRQFRLVAAPGHLLRRNHQRSLEIYTRHVGDDVTRQQFALMIALAQRPGASQRDLVGATAIDKSTLKEMLDRMIARGWVKRERHETDSRAWAMRITDAGADILHDRLGRVEAAQQEILAPLSSADRVVFMRCLRTMLGIEAEPPSANGVAPASDRAYTGDSTPISPDR